LVHSSGLAPFVQFFQLNGAEEVPAEKRLDWAIAQISSSTLRSEPGTQFTYSDLGFILLGRIVENVSGMGLDKYVHEHIYVPLGLKVTGFRPKGEVLARVAPTEVTSRSLTLGATVELLRGIVHDPNSRWLGGVTGHAGLFSSAVEVSDLGRLVLDPGRYFPGSEVLSPAGARAMTSPQVVGTTHTVVRGLAWDMESTFSYPRGDLFGRGVGHTGYTGTSIWLTRDPDLVVVVLTNRVHPDGKGDAGPLRARIANVVSAEVDR
jgi:CubicO group peptidase (beta-lactamase class C family)